ncbi:MAG: VTT domain-containing protein [Cytophagaceae bacterium]|nr:VTT domain-containing protein [Cytophagaceae bacterium]
MESTLEFLQQLLDPAKLIHAGGLLLILIVVFTENGIFFGFFLPGDTLLFTAGLFSATDILKVSIYVLIATICISAILGSLFGYFFGKKMGDSLLSKKDTLLFKKKYIIAAEAFFVKYGGLALVMGRFLPIIRTFAPIFAGIVKFDFKKFLTFNITGGVLWVFSMLLAGYFFGKLYPNAKDHLEYIVIGIIIITWIPVIRTYLKERKGLVKKSE